MVLASIPDYLNLRSGWLIGEQQSTYLHIGIVSNIVLGRSPHSQERLIGCVCPTQNCTDDQSHLLLQLGSKSACSKPIHYHEYTRTSGWAFSSLINRWCVFLKTIVTGTLFEHKSMKEWNDKSPVLWYLNSDQLMSFLSHFSVTQLHSTNLKNQLRSRVLYFLDTPRTLWKCKGKIWNAISSWCTLSPHLRLMKMHAGLQYPLIALYHTRDRLVTREL